ncbi:MAG: 50S ribosomal protein L23 [Verrucomicrobia bacterium]|nr:50S ribosomal protein L23 [Verrucomicrobiota bacterium]MBV9672893.1 50S ribosomal protein L23 [Verrucomicrobiota bacterium]
MKEENYIIHNIRLTEKASLLGEKHNQYVFRVDPRANKVEIRKAIERLFGKRVVRVNTCQYAGKKKRERRADFGRRPHWKKAMVTLAQGEKIDLA